MTKLEEAIMLATESHVNQFRKDGTPYIGHPLAVMEILRSYDFPEEALIIAVLHDVCEDSEVTNLEINEKFGPRVGMSLHALSKNKRLKKERKNDTVELTDYRFLMYINRFYSAALQKPFILLVKMADQIHNLSTLQTFPLQKQTRKIMEVEKYFLPIYEEMKVHLDPIYKTKYEDLIDQLKLVLKHVKK